jgi:hypothetical protein
MMHLLLVDGLIFKKSTNVVRLGHTASGTAVEAVVRGQKTKARFIYFSIANSSGRMKKENSRFRVSGAAFLSGSCRRDVIRPFGAVLIMGDPDLRLN